MVCFMSPCSHDWALSQVNVTQPFPWGLASLSGSCALGFMTKDINTIGNGSVTWVGTQAQQLGCAGQFAVTCWLEMGKA